MQGRPAFTPLRDHVYGYRLVSNMVTSALSGWSFQSDIASKHASECERLFQADLGNACAPSWSCTSLCAMLAGALPGKHLEGLS